jgi:DNA-binding FadR family transcriptional regulator
MNMHSLNDEHEVLAEHGLIVAALETGDSDAAREGMRAHVQAVIDRTRMPQR